MGKAIFILLASFLLTSCNELLVGAAVSGDTGPPTIKDGRSRFIEFTGTSEFVAKKENHTAKIVFVTKDFDETKHKIVRRDECDFTINGREPLGAECSLPPSEIASLKLFFDGEQIPVAPELYADCFHPPRFNDYKRKGIVDEFISIKFGDDSESVFVFLRAGDGGASYTVIWVLRKDGKHTRYTQGGHDCTFLDLACIRNQN